MVGFCLFVCFGELFCFYLFVCECAYMRVCERVCERVYMHAYMHVVCVLNACAYMYVCAFYKFSSSLLCTY